MRYKTIFLRAKGLLIQPGAEWERIFSESPKHKEAFNNYAIPFMGLCTLATFMGTLLNNQGLNFEHALKRAIVTFTALFFGLYLAAILLRELGNHFFPGQIKKEHPMLLVSYSATLMFAISLITDLIPELFFIYILIFYLIRIVGEGILQMDAIPQEKKAWTTLAICLIIVLCPILIGGILMYTMPGIRF